jgi:hypothetical protein
MTSPKISLDSSIALFLRMDGHIYKGLLETNTGLSVGVNLKSDAKAKIISLDFAIPFSVKIMLLTNHKLTPRNN